MNSERSPNGPPWFGGIAQNFLLKTLFLKPKMPRKTFSNESLSRCDRFRQIFMQIGAILASFWPLDFSRAVWIFTSEAAEVCDALLKGVANCHKHGVLHLDIKPATVWEVQQPASVVVKLFKFQFFEKSKSLFAFFAQSGHFCTWKMQNLESRHQD